jgi:hypothetical protein
MKNNLNIIIFLFLMEIDIYKYIEEDLSPTTKIIIYRTSIDNYINGRIEIALKKESKSLQNNFSIKEYLKNNNIRIKNQEEIDAISFIGHFYPFENSIELAEKKGILRNGYGEYFLDYIIEQSKREGAKLISTITGKDEFKGLLQKKNFKKYFSDIIYEGHWKRI